MVYFIVCGLLAFLFAYLSYSQKNRIFMFFAYAVLVYVIGLQDSIGEDYERYIEMFNRIQSGLCEGTLWNFEGRDGTFIELGWYILNLSLGTIINDFHIVSVVLACCFCYALDKILKFVPQKWYWFALFFFYFTIGQMTFCMSGLRQTMAIICFMLFTAEWLNKNRIRALLYIIVGLTFHNSMIFALPLAAVILIPLDNIIKYKKTYTIALISLYVIGNIFFTQIQAFFYDLTADWIAEDVGMSTYYLDEMMEGTGATLLRSAIDMLFFIPSIWAFYNIKDKSIYIILYYILSIILTLLFGTTGSLPRIISYITFMGIPSMCLMLSYIKNKEIRTTIIIAIAAITMMRFSSALINPIYMRYINFHTIVI